MPKLFTPLQIRDIQLKNRIIVSPMCMYSSVDGFANDWHLVHLGSRAVGGAALVMTEATAVSPEGRITPSDLGIWKDEHIDFLKRVTSFIEAQRSIAGMQLAHAGRKASQHKPWEGGKTLSADEGAWQTVAPSAIAFSEGYAIPHEMNAAEIRKVVLDFQLAAIRALKAGFKVIEIHAAHGYLIHEFLSPISNKRDDSYGGSFENRTRLVIEILQEIRKVWPQEYPVFVRISATDWAEGGWSDTDSVELARVLKDKGADLIDCSSGGNAAHVKIPVGPGYQVPFAERIKKETNILTGAVGIITTSEQAEKILKDKQADVVFLAREFLRDPYFPLHAANELQADVKWPVQYERAKR